MEESTKFRSGSGTPRRPKHGEAYWRGVVERHDASGLSVAAFCAAEALAAPSLYHWRRRLRQADDDAAQPWLIRLQPTSPARLGGAGQAVAELVGGDRMTVDAADLPALIAALRAFAAEARR